jgi:hypothetical protein
MVLVLVSPVEVAGCRRARLSRGDAAPVVVVAPGHDVAVARSLSESEPNDSPEQAQLLTLNAEWPVIALEGALSGQPDGNKSGKDVDVFKLLIPAGSAQDRALAPDSSPPEDPRRTARRLNLELDAQEGSLVLQLLDDGLKVMESVTAANGETAGLPDMAVQAGRFYYFRIRATAEPGRQASKQAAKPAAPIVPSKYKLSVQVADFDVADEREPNDSLEAAEAVTMAGVAELAGYYGWQHDQDFYRVQAPEVASALDVAVDGVEGVSPGLQVLTSAGARLATAKGRRGEKLALHNVRIAAGGVDAGVGTSSFFVVVKGEAGQNRAQRYVLHLSLGALKQDTEIEPNDTPGNATPIRDGVLSGFLPAGDTDCFVYEPVDAREVLVDVSFPAHVRGRVELSRASKAELVASAETKKPRQQITIAKVANLGQPLLVRIAPIRGDGNANEPYTLRISSNPSTVEGQLPEIRVSP